MFSTYEDEYFEVLRINGDFDYTDIKKVIDRDKNNRVYEIVSGDK